MTDTVWKKGNMPEGTPILVRNPTTHEGSCDCVEVHDGLLYLRYGTLFSPRRARYYSFIELEWTEVPK